MDNPSWCNDNMAIDDQGMPLRPLPGPSRGAAAPGSNPGLGKISYQFFFFQSLIFYLVSSESFPPFLSFSFAINRGIPSYDTMVVLAMSSTSIESECLTNMK